MEVTCHLHMCATSSMMLLKSHDPNVAIFGAKHMGFPVNLGYY